MSVIYPNTLWSLYPDIGRFLESVWIAEKISSSSEASILQCELSSGRFELAFANEIHAVMTPAALREGGLVSWTDGDPAKRESGASFASTIIAAFKCASAEGFLSFRVSAYSVDALLIKARIEFSARDSNRSDS